MKVYFAGSIRGGRNDQPIYNELIEHIKSRGVDVLCEHVGYKELTDQGQNQDPKFIHDRDIGWIDEVSAVIAKVTNPSLGVGYEIRYAIDGYKPVLALFAGQSDKKLSAMIEGSRAQVFEYERTAGGLVLAKTAITEFLHNCEYKDLRN